MNSIGTNQHSTSRRPCCAWQGCDQMAALPYEGRPVCGDHWDAIINCDPKRRPALIHQGLGYRPGADDRRYITDPGSAQIVYGLVDHLDNR